LGIESIIYEILMSYPSGTRYGGSNHANRSFGSKPVETGKEYNVQITETSRKGDGIARIQGFVIFVKDGLVGQDVKAKVTSVGERFATAEIVV
jgi:predicted RNA-binding protein with TRAM domain